MENPCRESPYWDKLPESWSGEKCSLAQSGREGWLFPWIPPSYATAGLPATHWLTWGFTMISLEVAGMAVFGDLAKLILVGEARFFHAYAEAQHRKAGRQLKPKLGTNIPRVDEILHAGNEMPLAWVTLYDIKSLECQWVASTLRRSTADPVTSLHRHTTNTLASAPRYLDWAYGSFQSAMRSSGDSYVSKASLYLATNLGA
ncbi:hypothetical protein Trco_006170 [Trichoderma cornu-damae]|uniref:Uncharacterized protein n=1 Tax=Trichoderma cornu-damae TaxID=654480 RepID=A0A9P8TTN3_9HYPO|nr:hypothetical protein Trco_006170 [Trichoderma cornu-damae]